LLGYVRGTIGRNPHSKHRREFQVFNSHVSRLAAYNWGPGKVDNALRMHKAFPTSVENYTRSVEAAIHQPVTIGAINIMQPNMSHDQVVDAVAKGSCSL
jgi:hypothetical protein